MHNCQMYHSFFNKMKLKWQIMIVLGTCFAHIPPVQKKSLKDGDLVNMKNNKK